MFFAASVNSRLDHHDHVYDIMENFYLGDFNVFRGDGASMKLYVCDRFVKCYEFIGLL